MAAVINDLPAPLLVPSTIKGVGENLGKRCKVLREPKSCEAVPWGFAISKGSRGTTLAIELTDEPARALAEAAK
jgi:hypothetical protein